DYHGNGNWTGQKDIRQCTEDAILGQLIQSASHIRHDDMIDSLIQHHVAVLYECVGKGLLIWCVIVFLLCDHIVDIIRMDYTWEWDIGYSSIRSQLPHADSNLVSDVVCIIQLLCNPCSHLQIGGDTVGLL